MPEDWTSWKIRVFWAWVAALIGSYFPIQIINLVLVRPLALGERLDSLGSSILFCVILGGGILSVAYLKIPKLYFFHPYTASRFRPHLAICLWIAGIIWAIIFLSEISPGIAARMHAGDPANQINPKTGIQGPVRWQHIQTGQVVGPFFDPPDDSGVWKPVNF